MTETLHLPTTIRRLLDEGAVFYVSHSGGKDSQAMYLYLRDFVPAGQIRVIHADLGEVEWEGVMDHARATIDHHELNVVTANYADGTPKDFFSMIRRRRAKLDADGKTDAPAFPSSAARFCTSDLKRDPLARFIRNDMKALGATLAVNAIGIRAEESNARAKKEPLVLNKRLSRAGREVWDWFPIFKWTTPEVFAKIAAEGQEPFWAYEHNERLSCVFCIFGSQGDLEHGAKVRPELARKLIELERDTRTTMFPNKSLEDRIGHLLQVKLEAT